MGSEGGRQSWRSGVEQQRRTRHTVGPTFSSLTLLTCFSRLKIGGNHALDVVEEELLGMGKGGKKLIFSTRVAKLFEVEVVRVKARAGGKTEDQTLESESSNKESQVSQEEEMDRKEESAGDVVGRMAKLGRAIVPGGGGEVREEKVRGEKGEEVVKEIAHNDKIAGPPNKEEKKIIEQETDMKRSTMVPTRTKREEGGPVDVNDTVGGGGGVFGGGRREGGGGGGGREGGGGVSEWSLVMSEVRLQNTELRMSLARVGEQLYDIDH